ncbi:hypothetical protein F5I97DRAFT_1827729 [Phlebopus sp. FC_14]|nr:hypothetical protein F5I97DRAFT_1827729 [Phlebopus sp. FC_14]
MQYPVNLPPGQSSNDESTTPVRGDQHVERCCGHGDDTRPDKPTEPPDDVEGTKGREGNLMVEASGSRGVGENGGEERRPGACRDAQIEGESGRSSGREGSTITSATENHQRTSEDEDDVPRKSPEPPPLPSPTERPRDRTDERDAWSESNAPGRCANAYSELADDAIAQGGCQNEVVGTESHTNDQERDAKVPDPTDRPPERADTQSRPGDVEEDAGRGCASERDSETKAAGRVERPGEQEDMRRVLRDEAAGVGDIGGAQSDGDDDDREGRDDATSSAGCDSRRIAPEMLATAESSQHTETRSKRAHHLPEPSTPPIHHSK